MEILLWLVPSAVVTLVAMVWVTWLGRESRGEVEPEVAAERMARALEKDHPARYAPRRGVPPPPASTGVVVRHTRRA